MKNLFVLLLFLTSSIFAQEKYLIYFKDKGINTERKLLKEADKKMLAEKLLSKKSIERRKKTLGENYFTFEDLPLADNYLNELKAKGVKIENKLKWFNAVSAYLDTEQVNELSTLSFIEKIEVIKKTRISRPIESESLEKKVLRKTNTQNKYDYGTSLPQNELSQIPKVHNLGITGKNVIIGLLDTGFNWKNKKCLKDKTVIAEYDFIFKDVNTANEEEDVAAQQTHGTNVFSIIAGFDEGELIGPAFNSKYLLAKTEYVPSETHAEEDNFAAALEWMDSIGTDIVSASLGYNEFDEGEYSYSYEDMNGKTTIVTKAAEKAFSKGIVVVNSAGNEGSNSWKYITAPADGKNVITVGAVTESNSLAAFSSRGPTYDGRIKPDCTAQGVSVKHVYANSKDDLYTTGSGTSYSGPIVAGIAGLLLSAHPHLTNRQVRSIFLESCDSSETPNNDVGYGLLSALKAVSYPNLKKTNDGFILNKVFDKDLDVDSTSVELVFVDGAKYPMTKNGLAYQVEMPELVENSYSQFYFNYIDSSLSVVREPKNMNYKVKNGSIFIDLVLTSVDDIDEIPEDFHLSQNYPNPFNSQTKIDFSIPEGKQNVFTTLKLYDILGREVSTLVENEFNQGIHTIPFSASGLSSGVYFYRLQAGNFVKVKKLMLLN